MIRLCRLLYVFLYTAVVVALYHIDLKRLCHHSLILFSIDWNGMPQFTQLDNAQHSAQYLVQAVADNLRQLLAKQERVTLAVSGGRSPILFFQTLSQINLDWQRVNITLVDERIVPTDHDDSNTHLVHQYLLQNQAKAATWLPMIQEGVDEGSLKNHQQVLDFALQHFVQPDIVVLGMGNDGHTASLFPQAPQLAEAINPNCSSLLWITEPVTAPHDRLTMTLNAIEQTTFLYLAIAGAEKRQIYEQAKQKVCSNLPISYVLHSQKVKAHVIYHD